MRERARTGFKENKFKGDMTTGAMIVGGSVGCWKTQGKGARRMEDGGVRRKWVQEKQMILGGTKMG